MPAPVYLEGADSEVYANKAEDAEGSRLFFKEFSFRGGVGRHCTPATAGLYPQGEANRGTNYPAEPLVGG